MTRRTTSSVEHELFLLHIALPWIYLLCFIMKSVLDRSYLLFITIAGIFVLCIALVRSCLLYVTATGSCLLHIVVVKSCLLCISLVRNCLLHIAVVSSCLFNYYRCYKNAQLGDTLIQQLQEQGAKLAEERQDAYSEWLLNCTRVPNEFRVAHHCFNLMSFYISLQFKMAGYFTHVVMSSLLQWNFMMKHRPYQRRELEPM